MKTISRKAVLDNARRVVVKVGSSALTQDNGLNVKRIRAISQQVCSLIGGGREVILVSSGAVACGTKKIGIAKPDQIPKRQAAAAVGQAGLILEYEKAFARYQKKVAQILLTSDGLASRKRYLNARNTINTLLSWQVVPIVNENDTVAVEELKFGDNDHLSAMITLLMDADVLINLTDIDGLYTQDPRSVPDAELVKEVTTIGPRIERLAGESPGELGTGGMRSKILAAKKVTRAGVPMIIADANRADILLKLFTGEPLGTYFAPKQVKLASRKSWIAFNLKAQGELKVDDGAAQALLKRGKSLLSIGIVDIKGDFGVGAPVAIKTETNMLGKGLVNYSASEIRRIRGLKSHQIKKALGAKPYDEVIHRDNLVILEDHP